jgi:hypothetical protein
MGKEETIKKERKKKESIQKMTVVEVHEMT